jgi:hypothetical protein
MLSSSEVSLPSQARKDSRNALSVLLRRGNIRRPSPARPEAQFEQARVWILGWRLE